MENSSHIFIVGVGRSGTTLMAGLLSANARIAVTPETHFIKRAEESGCLGGSPGDFGKFWKDLTTWSRFVDLGIDPDRCRELIESRGDFRFRAIFQALLDCYRENHGKPRIGEKTPGHWRYVDTLLSWYPSSKIIFMQRDPRAVVASQLKTPWMKISPRSLTGGVFCQTRGSQIGWLARFWAECHHHAAPRWSDDRRVLLVTYEHLVKDAESTLRQVCEFVGEDFDPGMLNRNPSAESAIPRGSEEAGNAVWKQWLQDHHEKASQPVSPASLEKWRSELSESEVALIEGICSHGMRERDYPLMMPPWRRQIGKTCSIVEAAFGKAERGGRSAVRGLKKGFRSTTTCTVKGSTT